ncbi:MAG: hypothetical protein ABJD97_22420, partial [Betaproteobacteria bacterium]
MRALFLACAVVALSGCAAPVITSPTAPTLIASQATTVTPETKLVCHKEAQTGSSMIHTVCETEQSAADRIAMQEQMRNMSK